MNIQNNGKNDAMNIQNSDKNDAMNIQNNDKNNSPISSLLNCLLVFHPPVQRSIVNFESAIF